MFVSFKRHTSTQLNLNSSLRLYEQLDSRFSINDLYSTVTLTNPSNQISTLQTSRLTLSYGDTNSCCAVQCRESSTAYYQSLLCTVDWYQHSTLHLTIPSFLPFLPFPSPSYLYPSSSWSLQKRSSVFFVLHLTMLTSLSFLSLVSPSSLSDSSPFLFSAPPLLSSCDCLSQSSLILSHFLFWSSILP